MKLYNNTNKKLVPLELVNQADIWSFGMTILELLEGHVPKYNPLAHTLTSQPPPWIASSSPILTASTINSSMVATITKEAKPVHQYIENLKASPQLIEFVSLCLHVKPDLRPSALELLRVSSLSHSFSLYCSQMLSLMRKFFLCSILLFNQSQMSINMMPSKT